MNALLVQGIMALFLVGGDACSKQAVETIVDFTAPVLWFFILYTTLCLFVFRFRNEVPPSAYRIPLYPLPPLLFLLACAYMLYSSLIYTGKGALVGAAILLTGVPVWFFISKYQKMSGYDRIENHNQHSGTDRNLRCPLLSKKGLGDKMNKKPF